jgi:hypothetical protein
LKACKYTFSIFLKRKIMLRGKKLITSGYPRAASRDGGKWWWWIFFFKEALAVIEDGGQPLAARRDGSKGIALIFIENRI